MCLHLYDVNFPRKDFRVTGVHVDDDDSPSSNSNSPSIENRVIMAGRFLTVQGTITPAEKSSSYNVFLSNIKYFLRIKRKLQITLT